MRAYRRDRFPGRLFIVEGIDGSGKSTQLALVLTDRYIYSLMARATIRGTDPQWVKGVYEFALKPDIVVYLRATVDELTTRVVQTSGFNYWESGMDLRLGDDMFDSFTAYQGRLLNVFDTMAREYEFHVVDSSASIQNVSEQIKDLVEPLLIVA